MTTNPIPSHPVSSPPADQTAVLAATLREVLDTFSPMKDTWDGPVSYYDGSADIEPEQYERWRAVLNGEQRRLADEAQPTETHPADPAPFTEARAAFMQMGRTPSLEGLRAELRIEGRPPLVGRYVGASMGRLHDVPGHEHLLAIDPRLIFEYADEPAAGARQDAQ